MIEIPNGMKLSNDDKRVEAITKRLEVTKGYCPCVPATEWNEDYICPCKNAREYQECHCGLFILNN